MGAGGRASGAADDAAAEARIDDGGEGDQQLHRAPPFGRRTHAWWPNPTSRVQRITVPDVTPIPEDLCVGGRELTEPRLSPGGQLLGWAQWEAVEAHLELRGAASEPFQLATAPLLRAGRGLGGGAWCFTPDGAAVVYVGADGNLWRQAVDGGAAMPLTSHGPERSTSSPCCTPDGRAVVHVLDQAEVWLTDLVGGTNRRLDDGTADFCADPHAHGSTVRWVEWDVPHMPWDHSRVAIVDVATGRRQAIEGDGAIQQPRTTPAGDAIWVRDDTGWLNLWLGDRPLVDEPFEHGGPSWGPGQRSFALSSDGDRVAFTRNEDGFGRLCVVDVATGAVTEVARGVHGHLWWEGDRLVAIRTGARTPTGVVEYDTRTWQRTVHAQGPHLGWADHELAEPTLVEAVASDGATLHGRLYAADQPDGRLIVWLHGGPTDQWQVTFMPRLAYWRSRGWSVLVPDHRGSTGHGRAYQQALQGNWGELDVDDTLAFASAAAAAGWGAPQRTVLIGGSAGGFTALGVLAREPGRFAAAVVLYPVTDLVDMAERSHRFERHYTDGLVGPLPDAIDRYRRRSPVVHADRLAATPLLVLHGDLDPVVPLDQSKVLAQRVNAVGGSVELHVYEGEGHGFRKPVNQLDEYRRIGAFLARHVPIGSQP